MRQGSGECMNRAAGTPLAAQPVIGGREQPAAADAVDQHAHRDAAAVGRGQRVDEAAAPAIVAEDIGRQADAVLWPPSIAASIGG